MIEAKVGNLFDSKAQTLVNTVNCVGIMGKGIAKEFRERFPDMFRDYKARCEAGEVRLGSPYLYKRLVAPWILNFPTKDHWRSLARLEDIEEGLRNLQRHYKEWRITSLAVPPLGCGLGQLEWRIVGPTLHRYLAQLQISVELYAPHGTPHDQLTPEFLRRQETPAAEWVRPGWVALVDILRRVESHRYHWPVGRTTFQKIAYVATEEGIPTGLEFRRASFGPFAEGIKELQSRMMNNRLIREQRKGRMFEITVGPTFEDARKAYASELRGWEPTLERVADLFVRMDTGKAEETATVIHATRELVERKKEPPSEKEVLDAVMEWKRGRRPAMDETSVALTIRELAALGWLKVKASPNLPLPEAAATDVF